MNELQTSFEKPREYQNDLSDYKAVLFDGWCGEPVAWGFEIIHRLEDERFNNLHKYGILECLELGRWALVIKKLMREEAEKSYGPITEEIKGPRGGWKSTTFGNKKFISKYLKP